MRVVATGVTQAPNDKEQVEPMLKTIKGQTAALGAVERLMADTGFSSEKNIKACEVAHIEPLIAVARDAHPPGWGGSATASLISYPPMQRRCRPWLTR